jgi:hypothetical protein
LLVDSKWFKTSLNEGCRKELGRGCNNRIYSIFFLSHDRWLLTSIRKSMARTRSHFGAAKTRRSRENPSTASAKRGAAPSKSVKPAKVIRDSFTMPVADHELIGTLKKRCIGLGIAIKKSELLRAGLASLEQLPDANLAQVVAAVESVKTGRPPGKKKKKKRKTNRAKDKN